MSIQAYNKAAAAFDTIGHIPVLSTISAVFIRFPMGIIAAIAKVYLANIKNESLSKNWGKISDYNFQAAFGELIPGVNLIFHHFANKNEWARNGRLSQV